MYQTPSPDSAMRDGGFCFGGAAALRSEAAARLAAGRLVAAARARGGVLRFILLILTPPLLGRSFCGPGW